MDNIGNRDIHTGKPFYQGHRVHKPQGCRSYHPYGWEFSKAENGECVIVRKARKGRKS